MGFSNQVIIPRDPFKPHIVKLQGLWRVSPYRWKKLSDIVGSSGWIKAHALANKLNDVIRAEQEAAKERQREFKRNLLSKPTHTCSQCGVDTNFEQCWCN